MADVWQTYGSWILYGIFFVLMVLMHAGMHGHAGHGRGRTAQDHEAAGRGAPADGAAEKNAHGSFDRPSHRHGGAASGRFG